MRLITDRALAIITIWQEARGQTYHGKLAVASVIRNRMNARYSSDGTVAGTVLRPLQFSGWNTKDPNRTPSMMIDDTSPVVQECGRAWDESERHETVNGAVLYYNPKIVPQPLWAKPDVAKLVAREGDHDFFTPITK